MPTGLFLSIEVHDALEIQKIAWQQGAVLKVRMVPRCSMIKNGCPRAVFQYPPDCCPLTTVDRASVPVGAV